MKGNMESMSALAQAVEALDARKRDWIAPAATLSYQEAGGDVLTVNAEGGRAYAVTDHAMGQLTDRLGIPRRYATAARAVPGLLAHNVNAWLGSTRDRLMVRTLTDPDRPVARAVLSDRYRPVDNLFLLRAIMPTLAEHQDLQVMSRTLTDQRMYLQVAFPRLTADVKVGDPVQYGLTISDSEIGLGAVDVSAMVWRLKCTNGMIGSSVVRRNHVGSRLGGEDGGSLDVWQRDTVEADLRAMELMLRDTVRASLDPARFDGMVAKLREAGEERIDDAMAARVVRNITKEANLTDAAVPHLLGNMTVDGGMSRYGVGQALTWWAQRLDNRDQQFDLERLGYQIMSDDSAWKAVQTKNPGKN